MFAKVVQLGAVLVESKKSHSFSLKQRLFEWRKRFDVRVRPDVSKVLLRCSGGQGFVGPNGCWSSNQSTALDGGCQMSFLEVFRQKQKGR